MRRTSLLLYGNALFIAVAFYGLWRIEHGRPGSDAASGPVVSFRRHEAAGSAVAAGASGVTDAGTAGASPELQRPTATRAASETGLGSIATSANGGETRVASGNEAPAFSIPLLSGGTLDSHTLQGHPVFINFWASWCSACREERPLLQALNTASPHQMFGIAVTDQLPAVRAVEASDPHGYPIGVDPKGDVAKRFGVGGLPMSFLVDSHGTIVRRYYGTLHPTDIAFIKRFLQNTL